MRKRRLSSPNRLFYLTSILPMRCLKKYPENRLLRVFHVLRKSYGPQRWWPAQSRLEVIVGAVLTQNTSWKNVEKAIRALKKKKLLSYKKLCAIRHEALSAA